MSIKSQTKSKEVDIQITEGSRDVKCTIWENSDSTRVLIIAPAMGVARRFYKTIATYFYGLSYTVISLDYFGMLEDSKTLEKNSVKLSDWGYKDINTVIGFAHKKFPKQKLFFLGHSIAGQVLPLAKRSDKIEAAYLIASQNVSSRNWSGLSKLKVNFFWHILIPFCTKIFGYVPAFTYGGKHDLHKSIALDWAKWGKSRSGILSEVPNASSSYRDINVPTKFLSFSDDEMLAPLKSVKHLYTNYGTPFKCHEHICPKNLGMKSIGHFKFFKKECQFLWPKIDSWFSHVANF